jgi:hypothetical protein
MPPGPFTAARSTAWPAAKSAPSERSSPSRPGRSRRSEESDRSHGATAAARDLDDRARQRRVRGDLEEAESARPQRLRDRRIQPHGLAQVANPVGRAEIVAFARPAVDGGVERHVDVTRGELVQPGAKVLQQRIHVEAVGGEVDVEPPREDAVAIERAQDAFEGRAVAGDQRGVRPVHRGQIDGVAGREERAERAQQPLAPRQVAAK